MPSRIYNNVYDFRRAVRPLIGTGEAHRLLVINTGSASTKVAIYEGPNGVWSKNIQHSPDDLARYKSVSDQLDFRKSAILRAVEEAGQSMDGLRAVVSRGGALRPMPGGVYVIDETVLGDLAERPATKHAANLSPPIAYAIAQPMGIPAYFVDPITVDEFEPLARLSGLPELPRQSKLHALSIRSTAHRTAQKLGMPLDKLNIIVAHLGSGISICPVRRGRMIDVNGADDEGPFSPERAGSLCMSDLVELCFSGQYTKDDMIQKITRFSGLRAHLGTSDARDVEKLIDSGDMHALEVATAMAYQVAREIGAMACVLSGDVTAIALTGGLASWQRLVDEVAARCSFIAPIHVFPGENEMEALAQGALRVLNGLDHAKRYTAADGGESRC